MFRGCVTNGFQKLVSRCSRDKQIQHNLDNPTHMGTNNRRITEKLRIMRSTKETKIVIVYIHIFHNKKYVMHFKKHDVS